MHAFQEHLFNRKPLMAASESQMLAIDSFFENLKFEISVCFAFKEARFLGSLVFKKKKRALLRYKDTGMFFEDQS